MRTVNRINHNLRPVPEPAERAGRVAVTGGLGFIGANLLERLLTFQTRPVAVDCGEPRELPSAVDFRQVDLRNASRARSALRDAELIFHLAGNADAVRSVREPRHDFESNALVTFNVLEAARLGRGARVVFLSTGLVYGAPARLPAAEHHLPQPTLPYAASKLAAEHLAQAFGRAYRLPVVIGRAFTVYAAVEPPTSRGEVWQFLGQLLAGDTVRVAGDPDRKTRDFIHIDDLVDALMLLGTRGDARGVYNIGTGVETSLRTLAVTLAELLDRPAPRLEVVPSPADEYRLVADVTRLRALGFEVEHNLRERLAQLIDTVDVERYDVGRAAVAGIGLAGPARV